MKRLINWNDEMPNQVQSDIKVELLNWRKKSSIASTNQNAIDQQHSQNGQKENQQSSVPSSSSINFTTDHPVELQINANNKIEKVSSVTITRRSSKPSRHESVQKATSQTRKRQRDRYIHHHHRLQENQLYSLNVSSNSIECYGPNCQPSVYNTSYRCRTITSENNIDTMIEFPMLDDDQEIKQNMSYVSLTNLTDLMDHEPNVSRRNSYSRSTSSILMHKPSLFLADVFNRMTHEQRAKSIAQLIQFHENRVQSSSAIDKLQKTTSLPNMSDQLTKLHSVTSLLSEKTEANNIQINNKLSSSSSLEQKPIDADIASEHINKVITSSPIIRSPIIKPSPILIKSNKSNTSTDSGKTKISRSNHFLGADFNEQSSKTKPKSPKIERTNSTEPSNLSNSIISSPSVKKQRSDNETKSKTNFENSLNNVTGHLSQQNMTVSNTNFDKSTDIPSKKANKGKQVIDEASQQLKPSQSDQKNSSLLFNSKETLTTLQTKPELTPLSPIDNENDTSTMTRTATASTNLTRTNNDDDNQSKLIDEELKRSSLGLARDSLELLRNTTPRQKSNDEQITPYTNTDTDSTPHQRKSVLKSHSDSSDNIPTPDLVSYVAIDEVKGNKQLLEEQMRRRSLTIGGGTVISCISPKPKRDSLTLLQERYSGSSTPHSGYYHLTNSESRHVEFIRQPGNAITPVLHIGRETKTKHPSNKPINSSDTSLTNSQRRPSLDSISRSRTQQTLFTTALSTHPNDIEQEKVYFTQNDYDEMLRLMMTPLSKTKKKYPIISKIELCVNHRLTTLQNLILVILLISFYVFIFIKSQYWHEHN